VPVEVRINARARTIAIRVSPTGDCVRLTLPCARALARGLRFVAEREGWIATRLAQLPAPRPFVPGAMVPVAGDWLALCEGPVRQARRDGDRLLAGGTGSLFAGRVRRWLVAEAGRVLEHETRALAARLGRPVTSVRVADPRSRWGSCGPEARIAYSWRLIMAPPFVRHALVAHEVAHLVEPNHGAGFWRLATELLGASHDEARRWLRQEGPGLHAWGRVAAPGTGPRATRGQADSARSSSTEKGAG
jgi:hypothetical protein